MRDGENVDKLMQNNMKLPLIALVILILIVVILFLKSVFFREEAVVPSASPFIPQASISPRPFSSIQIDNFQNDYERITQRDSLSQVNLSARRALIQSLGNKSGVLQNNENYMIEYLKTPDYFMAEIKKREIEAIKQEVLNWFISQGLSTEGFCNLPVVFYLSSAVNDQLRSEGVEFNPIPVGCI